RGAQASRHPKEPPGAWRAGNMEANLMAADVGRTGKAPAKPARVARETGEARDIMAREANKPNGTPRGRESSSQKVQVRGVHQHGTSKDRKTPMEDKIR
ncbi:MAG: hypothetical protein ACM3ZU_01020, partial [Bacteroidota bacterium]